MRASCELSRATLLLSVAAVSTSVASLLPRAADDDYDYDYRDTNMTNSTTEVPPTIDPILTSEAIANIVVSGTAVIFIIVTLTILFCTFEKGEHKLRIKTSLQRNRQIDLQVAAEKRQRELRADEFRQKVAAENSSTVLQVRTTISDTGEIRYEEDSSGQPVPSSLTDRGQADGQHHAENVISQSKTNSKVVVVDIEGDPGNERATKPNSTQFVEVSLDSYSPFNGSISPDSSREPGRHNVLQALGES